MALRLSDILDPSCVVLDVGGATKREVLAPLAAAAARLRPGLDGDALLEELVAREEASSTAIADGIAIPHARPATSAMTAALGLSRRGVEFDAFDGRPTHFLLALFSPADDPGAHTRWLAHAARVLGDPDTRRRLLEARDAAGAMRALAEREAALEAAA